MVDDAEIEVEVAYALPTGQKIIALKVAQGTSAFEAANNSGIARQFPDLDLESSDMGVFGKVVKAREYQLQAGDRVEIYRALIADPKEVRKKRAAAAKAAK
jgi:putative ubiquitin-RnfH superfamily antitoxin RatB of RatAB toxin-antitoxin module